MKSFENINNLNNEQLLELYDNIVDFSLDDSYISATYYCYGYCDCKNGPYDIGYSTNNDDDRTGLITGSGNPWAYLCSTGRSTYRGYKPCGSHSVRASYWISCTKN